MGNTPSSGGSAPNIVDLFFGVARERPSAIAIEYGDHRLSYASVAALTVKTALHLLECGVDSGNHVGISLRDEPDFLICVLAVLHIDAVIVPIDFRTPANEKKRLVDRFDIDVVIERRPPMEAPAYKVLIVDDVWRDRVDHMNDDIPVSRCGNELAMIWPTSGTTGNPAGIMQTHMECLARQGQHRENARADAQDRFFSAFPLAFRAAGANCLSRLFSGGTTILFPTLYDPAEFVHGVRRHRPTTVLLDPVLVRKLNKIGGEPLPLFPDPTMVMSTGGPLSAVDKRTALRHVSPFFHDFYATGLGGVISVLGPGDIDFHADSVGRPAANVDVEIVDDDDNPVTTGQIGHLRYRCPGMAGAIYGAQGQQSSRAGDRLHNGWAYPGEFARRDEEGYIYLCGRTANVIIRGSTKIFPEEIESVLNSHPAVVESAVVGMADSELGKDLMAFVVADGEVTADALAVHCGRHLAGPKRPRNFHFIDALPRSVNGKIVRGALQSEASSLR